MTIAAVSTMQAASSSSQLIAPGAVVSKVSQLSLVRIPKTQSLALQSVMHMKFSNPRYFASNKRQLVVYSEYSGRRSGGGAGDFFTGFLLGGVLFGAIGYLIAPVVSKSMAATEKEGTQEDEVDGPPKKLPKYVEDDEGLENTRKNLNEKIAQLNAAIDDVSAQLRADDGFGTINESVVELESAA